MSKLLNQETRKMLDMPFWFMQISMVVGWILMPSLTSIILFITASVSGFVYIVMFGKFAKEMGKNPTRWSMATLLSAFVLGPIPIWLSYYLAFNAVREGAPQSLSPRRYRICS
ncbi:MAG: hypothetical protein KME56_17430 [Candidatus Thiodiazotropha sp. (ex Ctena orbiculata)]|nr:hypothetical protein [Candidatus Thiodiazotropha taylori]MBT2998399.1 hypothetical protein [Candidatus Thiodiazotropha taylori]MBT3000310.1 hypothetical protein [Candidatus Thiodiazotropha taylori]MBV2108458.1 hypothetical protein [Candidatus Thiodiazotropha taylori]MBV2112917.1 hypothetical protein [Candidatus Thiodiazotropha taylori]